MTKAASKKFFRVLRGPSMGVNPLAVAKNC